MKKREKEEGGFEVFQEKQLLRRGPGGWKEGSPEDKCALSFQSERNPSLEAHIYMNRSSLEKTVFGCLELEEQWREPWITCTAALLKVLT